MANIDLEMGQFQKVTTLENKDYIVVSLDNGTQGQIKVSDLASVVAACLGNPIGDKGLITSSSDANNIRSNGLYQYYIEAGLPANVPTYLDRGVIMVFACGLHTVQIIYDYREGVLFRVGLEYFPDWKKL